MTNSDYDFTTLPKISHRRFKAAVKGHARKSEQEHRLESLGLTVVNEGNAPWGTEQGYVGGAEHRAYLLCDKAVKAAGGATNTSSQTLLIKSWLAKGARSALKAKGYVVLDQAQLREIVAQEFARAPEPRKSRLEARVSENERALMQRAAELTGRSLSDFVVHAAHRAALRTVENQVMFRLSKRDSDAFAAAMDAEATGPTDSLQQAYALRDKLVRKPRGDKG